MRDAFTSRKEKGRTAALPADDPSHVPDNRLLQKLLPRCTDAHKSQRDHPLYVLRVQGQLLVSSVNSGEWFDGLD
jgi:hypothetical protein